MDGKIRILFYNLDGAGVNYFRTQTPAQELERNHSDEFYVEINPTLDFNDPNIVEYLKSFHIIHYHRQFLGETAQMLKLAEELSKLTVLEASELVKTLERKEMLMSERTFEDFFEDLLSDGRSIEEIRAVMRSTRWSHCEDQLKQLLNEREKNKKKKKKRRR